MRAANVFVLFGQVVAVAALLSVSLDVVPGVGLGSPVLFDAIRRDSRRAAYPGCISLPVEVMLSGSCRELFGADAKPLQSGASGALSDLDVFSGVGGCAEATTITVSFSRAMIASDFIVLVAVGDVPGDDKDTVLARSHHHTAPRRRPTLAPACAER